LNDLTRLPRPAAFATLRCSMSDPVRVRFAPSPTGYLHVGGARTALFNWLHARHTGGKFILRIEDTDAARNTEAAMQAIYDGLRWLGLDWDEGPLVGGDYGPYFQSQRNAIYERRLEKLREAGHLYEDAGAVRFRSLRKPQVVDDMVCGRIEFDLSKAETHPDMTIRRPDGSWIFHFVNVVDDIEMKITHVIRGEDHLSNTPKHLELYEAFGAPPPRFAHIPLILNKDGTKMSKRDQGASVASYIEGGYVPEAVRNFLCLLGWSPKDDREKMDIREVIERFEPGGINRKPAHFDLEKCDWLNQQYILQMPLEELAERVEPWLKKSGVEFGSRAALLPVLGLVRERLKRLSDAPAWMDYFFTEDFPLDPEAVSKVLQKPGASGRLEALASAFRSVPDWTAAGLESALKARAAEAGVKAGEFVHPARVSVTGRTVGASLYHTLEVLGRDRVLQRIQRALPKCAA
jgi:glutamyl-tRNA synthetase